jgi:ABC-type transporter Mla MlaB component
VPRKSAANSKSRNEIRLEAECTLAQAPGLRSALVRMENRLASITIHAGATQRIDAASLQLLCAFVRDRRARGRAVSWQGPTQTIEEAARRLDLHGLLGFAPAGAPRQ